MTDWIYCAADENVDAEGAQQLLRDYGAIRCPPPGLRPWPRQHPAPGEVLYLLQEFHVHKQMDPSSPNLRESLPPPHRYLGKGVLRRNPEERYNTHLVWTSRDLDDAVVQAAEQLGYKGGQGMSFLLLEDVQIVDPVQEVDVGTLSPRFNQATEEQVAALEKVKAGS